MKITDKTISQVMSALAKRGHAKNPKPREYYVKMGKKSAKARRKVIPTLQVDSPHVKS